jgi:DHA2 family multidrug resistance protein
VKTGQGVMQETTTSADESVPLATWCGFALMCLGMFMAILDIQVVATSLPAIHDALAIAPDRLSWIQTAYLIAEVIAIPLSGWLTKALSLRRLFALAIALFTLASIGCATSVGFATLVGFRVMQGFAGGIIIPLVFTAGVRLFPGRNEAIALAIAGFLAVLAPTLGPWVGGWITQTYSWHWLFLLNVVPGIAVGIGVPLLLPAEGTDAAKPSRLDVVALALIAGALTCLEIGLKEAPQSGWLSLLCLGLFAATVAGGAIFIVRTWRSSRPIVELSAFRRPRFTMACVLSFFLGAGLYGSVYLMPVFLGFVRGHNALEIGQIMLVTGVAQLAATPIALALDKRVHPLASSVFGFLLFGIGLGMSTIQTIDTDYDAMFWPQVVRGVAVMFCLLGPTRLALDGLPPETVPDGSALFNLMRNLGGAIGIALIDTILYGRTEGHALALRDRLFAGDADAARQIGLDPALLAQARAMPAMVEAMVRPLVEKAAFVVSTNEAWMLLSGGAVAAVVLGLILHALVKAGARD